jgi:uncharacterized membrane protein
MRGDGFHPIMALLCLALIGAAIGLVVWLVAGRRPSAPVPAHTAPVAAAPSPTFQAEAILAERLARGDISPDDYRTTIGALRDSNTTT